jgi:hypothetical protein
MTTLWPRPRRIERATTFSPSLVADRNPISSGLALISLAYCARTASVFFSMSPSAIGAEPFASANSRPAATAGAGVGVMYAEFRNSTLSATGKSARTPNGSRDPPV